MNISREKFIGLAWAAIGATTAIALALWIITDRPMYFLLPSLGGSTVFLFALTETEAAQPRALFGGHLGGAAIGILCYHFLGNMLWVSVIAVVLTMLFMVLTRTIHPPAGANPLVMIQDHAGFYALLNPIGAGVLSLFLVAVVWSRFRPGTRYPVKWWN